MGTSYFYSNYGRLWICDEAYRFRNSRYLQNTPGTAKRATSGWRLNKEINHADI